MSCKSNNSLKQQTFWLKYFRYKGYEYSLFTFRLNEEQNTIKTVIKIYYHLLVTGFGYLLAIIRSNT